MIDAVLKFIGSAIAYGGGGAVVAYLLFQYLGKTWIENKFASRLDLLKHQHALELQRLRVEIDSMLTATVKLQEKEFQLLPEAWHKLDEAHGLVRWLTSPMQEFPNVDRMSDEELEEFLESSELLGSQKQKIRSSTNRLRAYEEAIFWHRLHRVNGAVADLESFVARNGVFFPMSIKNNLTKVSHLLWQALTSKRVGHEAKDYKLQSEGWKKIQEEAEPLYKQIEADIHARLRSHAKQPEGA
ncbi:MAG: hypothetical protein U1F56_12125 [Rubrivivax sp.]